MDAGASVHPEGPPMKRGGKMKVNARPERELQLKASPFKAGWWEKLINHY